MILDEFAGPGDLKTRQVPMTTRRPPDPPSAQSQSVGLSWIEFDGVAAGFGGAGPGDASTKRDYAEMELEDRPASANMFARRFDFDDDRYEARRVFGECWARSFWSWWPLVPTCSTSVSGAMRSALLPVPLLRR